MNNLKEIRKELNNNKMIGILITNLINIKYLTGFNGSNAIVYITKTKAYFLTDFRYKEQVKIQVNKNYEIKIIDRNFNDLDKLIKKNSNVWFESSMSYEQVNKLKNNINASFFSKKDLIENLRMIKSKNEIKKIQKSINLLENCFNQVIKNIKVGKTKEIDVALDIYSYGIKNGSQGNSFESIVASGIRSSMPHAKPSNEVIKSGSLLTIDSGFLVNEYASDLTRTYKVGKSKLNKQLKEIYEIVLEANNLAIKAVKPGMKCYEIDKIARDYITSKGYGDYFGHGLGHSYGLEVHEKPYLNQSDETIIQENMVFTIEPGIYIDGLGGVRIEDDILVTKNGCKVLSSKLNKQLTEI